VLGSYSAYKLLYTAKSPLLRISSEPAGETPRLSTRELATGAPKALKR
jgi:hypothetical protein